MQKRRKVAGERIVANLDFPHLRNADGSWIKELPVSKSAARQRLVYYAERLHELGMTEKEIRSMFSELYWDSFVECVNYRTFEKFPTLKK